MSQDVVLEMFYPHPPERVWQALTDRRTLSVWMMNNDFELQLGHRFRFHSCPLPELEVTIHCEVLEVEAPKRLVYSWKAHPSDAASRVIWTLSPVEGGTQVRLQHRAIGSAPIPGLGMPVFDRSMRRTIDSQLTSTTALIHPLQTLSSTSKDGLPRPSKLLNRQTNWHYWLQQKLPEVLAQSSV
ncbi:SRPBCC domain-containing protein [Microcoleus sp. FACHB-1515]|uniref:SRPBCC family protein n=1 Tax=Cyanophyceae TaxID=3028117 RepID=UPI0016894701|nr:SRPBCC domain-containing protein [Microcoleus sp. FACHB-1515]MBD2091325.1 SRPBCC domain-containing protein [Microcoleus sp. FACHB-1515]